MDCMLNRRIVSGGSSGSLTGFTLKFPATATNWSATVYIMRADGTSIESYNDYSALANQQFENVVSIVFTSAQSYRMFKATLEKGSMLQYFNHLPESQITTVVTNAPGTLPTPMGVATETTYLLLSDVTFSAVEMYNTD